MFGQAIAKDGKPGSLAHLVGEFRAIAAGASAAAENTGAERIGRRPSRARWSVAENLIHLTLSSEAYLPIWREALERARAEAKTGLEPYELDAWGRFWVWGGFNRRYERLMMRG